MFAIRNFPRAYGWYVLGIAIAFVIWEAVAALLGNYRLPSFLLIAPEVFPLLVESRMLGFQGGGDDGYWPHLLHTIGYTVGASALGVFLGVSFALAVSRSRVLRAVTEVPIELLRTIPPLAAIPFILIWIGPGNPAQLMMVGYYVFVMMVVTTLNAAANINPVLPTFAATLGASRNRIFATVILPAMVPAIVGGLRVALGVAWGVQIVAELMGGKLGMGRVFSAMISFQALDAIIVGIIWVSLAAALVDFGLVLLMRRITRWAPKID
ncbi:MAG: ABC transporter permease subunit [Albidovulum sp.]|nr:ABC transporter permease subunit [Albidovulum sp.]